MKGTAKGRYGLQFMVGLALRGGQGPVLVEELAGRQSLPPKFVRVLLGPLKAAGLVKAQRGAGGGCELARHPSRITALEVLEALEGRLGAGLADPGASASARTVREVWLQAAEAARIVLKGTTLADLAARQQTLEADSHSYSI